METINVPYRKQYDEKGKVLPISEGKYLNEHPNRKHRRAYLQNKSFTGNHKGISLTVSGTLKYKRITQRVNGKSINHYLPLN